MSSIISLFYLYDPWFNHFFRMAFFTGMLVCVYWGYQCYHQKSTLELPWRSLGAIIALIGVSAVPLLINGSKDFSVMAMYSKMLLLFMFGVAIYQCVYRHQPNKMLRDLKVGIGIQALLGFITLFGSQMMIDFLWSVHNVRLNFYHSEQEYRLYNLTSSAFFQLSLFYLFLLHFLLAQNRATQQYSSWWLLPLLCIGVMSGRTFFMFSVVSVLIYFHWRYLPALIGYGVIIFLLARYFPDNRFVQHALEPVINLLQGADELSSSTTTLMQKHLFMPEIKQLLLGDGCYFTADKHYYGGSDSGFIRQTLYGGVGYMLACLAFTAYFLWKVCVNWFQGKQRGLFFLSTIGLFTVLNVKADTYAFPGIMMILLLFLSLFEQECGKNV